MKKILSNFKGKKVLITGHTGFKGSWLSLWLIHLGAKVIGISSNIPTEPSNFKINKLNNKIENYVCDIRNEKKLSQIINKNKPDFIFHLAAQSLVKESYSNPKYTFETNSLGTLNLLESLKKYDSKKICSVVVVTSDKSYKNLELKRGYTEEDILGGHDPYSASKACAELIIKSYFKSFLLKKRKIKISVARAGNVIGGGDWSKDRLIPDCIRSISSKKKLLIRFPKSTRPWQYVLEPLYGYMLLAIQQKKNIKLNGQAFNFGPNNKSSFTVLEIIKKIKKRWNKFNWKIVKLKKSAYESKLLKLNSNKAQKFLNWKCFLNADQSLNMVIDWYKFYSDYKSMNMYSFSINQIKEFENFIKRSKNKK
tara:strand:+ start:775 stop:1872 length:1098 start_codon:yes stop_codon:yes gene_type:complete